MGALGKLMDVITRAGLLLIWNEGKKEGKSKINSSCECLGKALKELSRRAVVGHSDLAARERGDMDEKRRRGERSARRGSPSCRGRKAFQTENTRKGWSGSF